MSNSALKFAKVAIPLLLALLVLFILFNKSSNEQELNDPVIEEKITERLDQTSKTLPDNVGSHEAMIAGVPASNTSGKFAEQRPEDLEPYSRWVPPIAREAWLNKTKTILQKLADPGYTAETRDVYFHLGYKDKPASCGSFRYLPPQGETAGPFQRFIYTGRATTIIESELPSAFDELWRNLCVLRLYE
jgi:hypothetical protein